MNRNAVLLATIALLGGDFLQANDWLGFRGGSSGVWAENSEPPIKFSTASDENIAWSAELPGRTVAGSLVVGDAVISTGSGGMDNHRIYVVSHDLATGRQNWFIDMFCRGRPYSHPYSTNAAPTAVSDGERIYAFYSSNDVICVDLQGQLQWYQSLATLFPKTGNDTGMSSSPVVVADKIVLQCEAQGDSYVAALDKMSGELRWRVDRPTASNWASPVVVGSGDDAWILATSRNKMTGLDPADGRVLFDAECDASSIASATANGNRFLVPGGGLTCYEYNRGDAEPQELWSNRKLGTGNSSPVWAGDKIWTVKGSVLTQASAADGSEEWKLRLPDASTIYATPVIAGNRAYILSDNGKCWVVAIGGEEGELLATSEVSGTTPGTPAIADDALIIRGDQTLWKIAADE